MLIFYRLEIQIMSHIHFKTNLMQTQDIFLKNVSFIHYFSVEPTVLELLKYLLKIGI